MTSFSQFVRVFAFPRNARASSTFLPLLIFGLYLLTSTLPRTTRIIYRGFCKPYRVTCTQKVENLARKLEKLAQMLENLARKLEKLA